MNKYKICVYAICKNEEKFVKRWVESMKEADQIYVLDTGSTDDTVEKLKNLGVTVKTKEITPWRFDIARNESLKMVDLDADICVCTDLDEVFNKGWRKKLEQIWDNETTCLYYNYNWALDEYNNPKVNFYIGKIHTRNNYVWTHPVHEVLKYNNGDEKVKIPDEITLNHYPDISKSRSSYLPLLELSVKEDPEDDRNMHYLGREYMYYKKWDKAIETLIKHLGLKKAVWKDERCASMRFISRCYQNLNRYDEAEDWLKKAIDEAPYLRDAYMEMALLQYKMENWDEIEKNCLEALKITNNPKSYINEPFTYDETVYDLLSITYFHKQKYEESLKMANIALQMNPKNVRILNNINLIEQYIK